MLLTAPGNTSQIPYGSHGIDCASRLQLPTQEPESPRRRGQRVLFCRASALAPACPPSPSITILMLDRAAMCVTRPRSMPSFSSSVPCSICSSTNLWPIAGKVKRRDSSEPGNPLACAAKLLQVPGLRVSCSASACARREHRSHHAAARAHPMPNRVGSSRREHHHRSSRSPEARIPFPAAH